MRRSFVELKANDPMRMAAATAFFTTFALPAILIILIQLFGLFLNPRKISAELISTLEDILGNTSAQQIEQTLVGFNSLSQNWYVTILGFVFLMFVATNLFEVVKHSLDEIWNIRVKPHPGLIFGIKNRLSSLSIILLSGFLFFTGLFLDGVQVFLAKWIEQYWQGSGLFFIIVANQLVLIVITTIWFTYLFRFLTAGHPKFSHAFAGGFFTAVLFTMGKFVIRYLVGQSNINSIYGASGSMVLILLFVFYSSMIFYYGGCFVKVLSEEYHSPIRPVKEAFSYETTEVDNQDREKKV